MAAEAGGGGPGGRRPSGPLWTLLLFLTGLRPSIAASSSVSLSGGSHCQHRVPSADEVIYKVHLKTNHVLKRDVDQHLRIKIVNDKSIEELLPEKKHLIKNKLFPQAISYLEKTFQVRRRSGPILLSRQCSTNQYIRKRNDPHRYCKDSCAEHTKCGPIRVPEEHLQPCWVCREPKSMCGSLGLPGSDGIKDADFVLYVSALTTERCSQENIIAYAAYCQQEAEMDRPVAGYANLCPNMISTQPQEFIGMLSTVKHEIIHALGFSAGLFAFYHDNDGKPLTSRYASGLPPFNSSLGLYQWSDKVVRKMERLWDVQGSKMIPHSVFLLVTPRVVDEARKHFNCPILEGMELENQGGLGTELNHWEKRLLENEAMTGSHTQNRVLSRITLALMEDTGWYKANYSMAETLDWGRGKGCDFVMKSCKFWIDQQRQKRQVLTPYCDTLRSNPLQLTCRQDRRAVAVCNLQKFSKPLPQEYQVSCSPQGLKVWVQNTTYLCSRAGQVLTVSTQINGWIHDGDLLCPACWDFCELCPPETDPPISNFTRALPLDLCSCSSSLVVTLWLLLANLFPLLAGFLLCALH
ncbi:leishmanolysin-like peptidase isoform X2 [Monodelphis domestica]|uniref:leishmanolysin-like peptidase isoform X2 n=1 Tax=Monodelphis domestica TaxID=13616 RepID=UPI0024E21910|nr:leishmanolysin-like peptidase isoform X2 [Monodelphis domestica]